MSDPNQIFVKSQVKPAACMLFADKICVPRHVKFLEKNQWHSAQPDFGDRVLQACGAPQAWSFTDGSGFSPCKGLEKVSDDMQFWTFESWDRWDAVWLHVWPWHYWCNFYCMSATGEALGCQQAALHGLRRPGESIWSSSTGCHLVGNAQRKLGIDEWLVVSGPVHVQGCEKQGKSRRWVQRGV